MHESRYSRSSDHLTITSPNGVAVVSRTPEVGVAQVRPWMLVINDTLLDTYDDEGSAIDAANEILALKP